MGYERLTASDDIDSGDRNDFDSIIAAQEGARRRRIVREKLERLAWIFFSVAVVWYGDGTDSLFELAARRAKVQRIWFLLATISLAANFGILCHLIVHHQFHRRGSKWEVNASWALPASSSFGVTSFVGFGVILWPIYGWATPLIEGMLCMGFLMMTYFIPSTNMLDHKNQ